MVDFTQNLWYHGCSPTAWPEQKTGPTEPPAAGNRLEALKPAPGLPPHPGEGEWTPGARITSGTVALYTTAFRPDAAHPGTVVGVAWLDQQVLTTSLTPGIKEPTLLWGGPAENSQVPASLRPRLVAVFNSGYRMREANGGFYLDGRTARPLRDGAASVVVKRDGTVDIGQWGRDMTMGPDVLAVRQSLDLIVDHGRPLPDLATNPNNQWGAEGTQNQCTWRSGLGVDAQGNLRYVAGNGLTLTTLASAMQQAGIIRGLQLDIHNGMAAFIAHHPGLPSQAPTPLLPSMPGPTSRYLVPDQRDFFTVALRTTAPAGS
ncbi:phosphodiester glycosidase family protein [Labedaea rhizosphaerae]|uniref:phosphodiester glycosidase family protein n=1 Tax=Labedaea rhizosphaerae TaxID=598644 RepID=UPI00105BDB80|nr:phosphodiester glycosidase family protein [Labedaea rhizosphaerae]